MYTLRFAAELRSEMSAGPATPGENMAIMVLHDLVIGSHNLLDGTWRVASTTLNDNEGTPAQQSRAAAEIATNEAGPSGDWGQEPALTASSFATMANFAAADHLGCLASLITPEQVGGIFGPLVVARSCVEASARAWWLLDPSDSVRERVGKSFRVRLRSVDETTHLIKELLDGSDRKEADPGRQRLLEELESQRLRRLEILEQAVGRGIPVHYEAGELVGINVAMPKNDELVGALLQDAGATLGAAIYVLLSGVTHATPYALLQYFSQVGSDDPLVAHLEPRLSDESLLSTTTVVLLAFIASFGRLVDLYGWDPTSWQAWARHGQRKILEIHRALTAYRSAHGEGKSG